MPTSHRSTGSWSALALCFGALTDDLAAQCATQWLPSSGTNGAVHAFTALPNGDLVAGGSFTSIAGTPANGIARRSGGSWTQLGTGIAGTVRSLVVLPNGDLVAGGEFTAAGGVAANHIARWDGTTWSALGVGMSGWFHPHTTAVHAMAVRPNGDLIAAGHFLNAGGLLVNHIARWDGAAWSSLAGGLPGMHLNPVPIVRALATLPGGDLCAAGQFPPAGNLLGSPSIARWNGTNWTPMGAGWPWLPVNELVRSLVVMPNGELIGAGWAQGPSFMVPVPFVARWAGSSWVSLGGAQPAGGATDGAVLAMAVLPDGDLLVGGRNSTASGGSTNQLLRRNGTTWSGVGGDLQGEVFALAMAADGTVAVGGNFTSVGGVASPAFAQLASTCPAGVVPVGTGCAGPSGPMPLTAVTLPWLGSTFRAVASGLPPSSLALAISSVSPATIPLSAVLPVGGNCDGLVNVGLSGLLLPVAGQVESALPLPDVPSLAGVAIHQYVAVLEFGVGGNLVALTGTNRLTLTLGTF